MIVPSRLSRCRPESRWRPAWQCGKTALRWIPNPRRCTRQPVIINCATCVLFVFAVRADVQPNRQLADIGQYGTGERRARWHVVAQPFDKASALLNQQLNELLLE